MNKPNFLIFMTDHQRGDTQPPRSLAKTPNLDRLYAAGVSFTDAYCPSPHCCPSRATFFSGLYPSEHGVWNNVNVSNALSFGLYDNVRLFSEDLKDAGYRMYFSGKWHVSAVEGPDARGFELLHHNTQYRPHPHVANTDTWNRYGPEKPVCDDDTPRGEYQIVRPFYPLYDICGVSDESKNDRLTVEAAVGKLRELDADVPFCMFVAPHGPHDPYFVPQRFLDLYDPEEIRLPESWSDRMEDKPALYRRTRDRFAQLPEHEQREALRHYLAFCSYEDELFGTLLDTLEQRNLLQSTVVVYVSDHGDYAGAHGLWTKGLPCFREAYHVCSVIGFGGVGRPGRSVAAPVSLADYAPTFLELAGLSPGRKFTGRSLAAFLRGEEAKDWRREKYTQTNGNEIYGIQRSVSDGCYKYVFNAFDYDELYDLTTDPNEIENLINLPEYRPVVRELCKKMWRFAREHSDAPVSNYIMTAMAPYGPGIVFEDGADDKSPD